jgi:hypothetical protein
MECWNFPSGTESRTPEWWKVIDWRIDGATGGTVAGTALRNGTLNGGPGENAK